ncbi:Protein of unknown function [Gryllus bimaculatus]|nr:Protein of unknown function [Gryllus bimaculatus]
MRSGHLGEKMSDRLRSQQRAACVAVVNLLTFDLLMPGYNLGGGLWTKTEFMAGTDSEYHVKTSWIPEFEGEARVMGIKNMSMDGVGFT